MAEGDDEYKKIIRQCMGSVKEVLGEVEFDDVVASIMKMQEKVLASGIKGAEAVGQIASGEGSEDMNNRLSQLMARLEAFEAKFSEDMRIIKKRILRLERAVLGGNNTTAQADDS
ncbi:MAG: hypothetical protein ACTJLL_03440 [Anaplasma sp.]